eukprot:COSAG06_NODE_59179_length_275_cov_0.573864_1_plen_91_part_11
MTGSVKLNPVLQEFCVAGRYVLPVRSQAACELGSESSHAARELLSQSLLRQLVQVASAACTVALYTQSPAAKHALAFTARSNPVTVEQFNT